MGTIVSWISWTIIITCSLASLADTTNQLGKKKLIGIYYYQQLFGHLHQNPSIYSMTLTTIACNHPMKAYQLEDPKGQLSELYQSGEWLLVEVAGHQGYILKKNLAPDKLGPTKCFQDRYPRFFDQLNMDVADFYYWGRLYDLYLTGKTSIP